MSLYDPCVRSTRREVKKRSQLKSVEFVPALVQPPVSPGHMNTVDLLDTVWEGGEALPAYDDIIIIRFLDCLGKEV